jgi:hypothetical protein
MEKETASPMKLQQTTLILPALVVLLGFINEAGANINLSTENDLVVTIGHYDFGFSDCVWFNANNRSSGRYTNAFLGPLGNHRVPFTATQGLVGFCVILALLITLPAMLAVRWKKKRLAQ